MSRKYPPKISESKDYLSWKKSVKLRCEHYTDLESTKPGVAVLLSLDGAAREAVLELTEEEISAVDGVKKVLDRLEKLF